MAKFRRQKYEGRGQMAPTFLKRGLEKGYLTLCYEYRLFSQTFFFEVGFNPTPGALVPISHLPSAICLLGNAHYQAQVSQPQSGKAAALCRNASGKYRIGKRTAINALEQVIDGRISVL